MTILIPTMAELIELYLMPVPCVPVAIAPARLWVSISPRFGRAKPIYATLFKSEMVIPAPTVTRNLSLSILIIRFIDSIETKNPSVNPIELKLCPLPIGLI